MKICQHGTGKSPTRKGISNTRAKLWDWLKNACEKLTQKQRRITVWALLILFTVLAVISVTDIFRGGTELSGPGHISPVKISEDNSKDTISLKITDNETEQ